MDEGEETGEILYISKKYDGGLEETYLEVLRILFNESSKIINNLLLSFENNKLSPQKQINKLATHTSTKEKKSGKMEGNKDAPSINAK
jgi:Methionyl-tRNA formyltransferase